MHSVLLWRALSKRHPESVGPLVFPGSDEDRAIFAKQIGESNLRSLGCAALVDPGADPVVVQDDFYVRLCALAREERCDHIHILWGFLHPRQIELVPPSERIPVTITLCDATGRGEEADVDAMFFGSDRWERYLRETLRVPAGYLAISDRTRNDALVKGVKPEHLETVHLWVDPKLASMRAAEVDAAPTWRPDDYVAYVGGLAEYKGVGHILDFALLYPEHRVKMTGYTFEDFPIEWARYPSVEYLGYIPYTDVVDMMRRSRALLYLSYSEGFGLPMIEAQTLGVPVIVNPRNVMVKELLAPGSYVSAGNVGSPTSIKAAIQVAVRDRASIVARGFENAKRFDEERQVAKLVSGMERAHERLRKGGWAA
ncbi:MAG: glycosyltransferase [Labilithrix sp.]|nr:glycosyltransferase [Labilithrix sp.]